MNASLCCASLVWAVLLSPGDRTTVEQNYGNGALKVRRQMQENDRGVQVRHGLEIAYYLSGREKSRTQYKDGNKEGDWIIFSIWRRRKRPLRARRSRRARAVIATDAKTAWSGITFRAARCFRKRTIAAA